VFCGKRFELPTGLHASGRKVGAQLGSGGFDELATCGTSHGGGQTRFSPSLLDPNWLAATPATFANSSPQRSSFVQRLLACLHLFEIERTRVDSSQPLPTVR
jgi:hypothetical protein